MTHNDYSWFLDFFLYGTHWRKLWDIIIFHLVTIARTQLYREISISEFRNLSYFIWSFGVLGPLLLGDCDLFGIFATHFYFYFLFISRNGNLSAIYLKIALFTAWNQSLKQLYLEVNSNNLNIKFIIFNANHILAGVFAKTPEERYLSPRSHTILTITPLSSFLANLTAAHIAPPLLTPAKIDYSLAILFIIWIDSSSSTS